MINVVLTILLLYVPLVSSGSDSDTNDEDKSNADDDLASYLSRESAGDEFANSGDSSAAEDDFNPFGGSGSEDEGHLNCALYDG